MVDEEDNEKEIFFSDYVTEKKSLELASLRRTGGTQTVLSPRSQQGTNVGIKSFTWDYTNKHEGDRILKADLELYFGSLAELANVNYLQFLFVNGRQNPLYPSMKPGAPSTLSSLSQQSTFLREEVNDMINRYPEAIEKNDFTYLSLDTGPGDLLNYRKLKVACGWSVPKGSQEKLLRMFTGDSSIRRTKLDKFLNSVKNTQRVITLNLADYQVNFSQEGPTTLSITYIGSADNYLSQITSDIFGTFNSALSSDHTVERFEKEDIPEDLQKALEQLSQWLAPTAGSTTGTTWADTYLRSVYRDTVQLRSPNFNATPFALPMDIHYAGLRFDERFLRKQVALETLELSHPGLVAALGQQTLQRNLDRAQQELATVERMIEVFLKFTETRRFAAIFATMVQSGDVHRLDITHTQSGVQTKVDTPFSHFNDVLRNAAERYFEQLMGISPEIEQSLAQVLDSESPVGSGPGDNTRRIYYIKFGDFLKTACTIAGLREDIKFVVGSINVNRFKKGGQRGVPPGTPNSYISIYDLPISLEYIMQLFFDKVVQTGRTAYPMRNFVDDLLSLASNLINNITGYQIQTNLSMTVYTSYDFIQEKILFPHQVENYQQRVGSLIYKPVGQRLHNHYVIFAKQMDNTNRFGDKATDEADGIYHYALGSDRGIAREFNFKKIDMPQRQAMLIEAANYAQNTLDQYTSQSRALILPQDIEIVMFGNTLHRNGDILYIDSRAALGEYANAVLTLGGYYRVVRSIHKITPGGYTTTLQCKFELPTGPVPPNLRRQGP